jgi:SAM-dependent methyltransferase
VKDGWANALTERARAYWTPDRTRELAGDKALLLPPADAAPLLRALGLLRADASMPPPQVRKYFQCNHMVTLLAPAMRELRARHAVTRIVDAGCGRSYLTLLLAWVSRHQWGHPIEVLGVDRDADVIAECRRRTELAGLAEDVRFEAGPIEDVRAEAHAVISLHACDTATCDALALGIARGADLIAVAPCCQAELARGWAALPDGDTASDAFAPIRRAPHLRRELGADVTDAMRLLLLRAAGYDASAVEFVPSVHTRKNTLIRAVRRGAPDPAARAEYEALKLATGGVGIRLADALRQ